MNRVGLEKTFLYGFLKIKGSVSIAIRKEISIRKIYNGSQAFCQSVVVRQIFFCLADPWSGLSRNSNFNLEHHPLDPSLEYNKWSHFHINLVIFMEKVTTLLQFSYLFLDDLFRPIKIRLWRLIKELKSSYFHSWYTVPTHNSDIFVRPKKVSLFWEMSLFWKARISHWRNSLY